VHGEDVALNCSLKMNDFVHCLNACGLCMLFCMWMNVSLRGGRYVIHFACMRVNMKCHMYSDGYRSHVFIFNLSDRMHADE
jgi:hypothetical protein